MKFKTGLILIFSSLFSSMFLAGEDAAPPNRAMFLTASSAVASLGIISYLPVFVVLSPALEIVGVVT